MGRYTRDVITGGTPGPAGPPGADGVQVNAAAENFDLLMLGADGTLMPAGVRRLGSSGDGDVQFDETAIFPQESVQIGYSGIMSAFGAVPKMTSYISGREIIQPFTYISKADGSERSREITLAATENLNVNATDTTALPTSGMFTLQATSSEALTNLYFRAAVGEGITGLRFSARVQGQTEPFYYFPSRVDFDEGTGQDFADSGNTPNEMDIDLEDSPIIVFEAQTIEINYALDTGSILGDGTIPYLSVDRNVITLTDLSYRSETDAKEDGLGNPTSDGQVLSSTADGTRSWITLTPGVPMEASITSFSIQGQSTIINAGDTLDGTHTFVYAVENPGLITGTGTISQDGTNIITGVSPTGTSTSGAITSATLNAGESTTFTLTFTLTAGGTITRNFVVRGRQPAETLYHGIMATDIPSTVDVSTLTMQDIVSGTQFNADFDIPNTQYAVILSPADREVTDIEDRTFNQDILTDFTKTENVRTINGQLYDSYVHQNNAGVQGILSTRITVG